MSKKDRTYQIGYGKPPKSGQFRKGTSGNPAGRPKKGPPTFLHAFAKELRKKIQLKEGGKARWMAMIELIAKQYTAKAANGDTKAARLIMDLMRGSGSEQSDNLSPIVNALRSIHAMHEAVHSDSDLVREESDSDATSANDQNDGCDDEA